MLTQYHKQARRTAWGRNVTGGIRGWLSAHRAAAVALLIPFAAFLIAGAAVGGAEAGAGEGAGPILDWLDDVIDDIQDAVDDLADAEEAVAGQQGPLDEPDLSRVAAALDDAMAIINRIQDPNQYPSLDPADTGSIDTTWDPSLLSPPAETPWSRRR